MSRTVILVPRRSDGGHRDFLWSYARDWWEVTEFEIVEGDHTEGPFNRSAALNTASETAGDWDTAILLDSDVLVDRGSVNQAIELATYTGRVVFPFREYKALNRLGTDRVMKGFKGNWNPLCRATFWDNKSACVVVPRSAWESVGGFDERFVGWGWEDVAFATTTDTMAGNHLRLSGQLWHLWHERSPENDHSSPLYIANRDLCHRYIEATGDRDLTLKVLSESGGPLS